MRFFSRKKSSQKSSPEEEKKTAVKKAKVSSAKKEPLTKNKNTLRLLTAEGWKRKMKKTKQ